MTKRALIATTVAAFGFSPLVASAQVTASEVAAIYTPANIQVLYPGYSSGFYSTVSQVTMSTLTGNSSCVTAIDEYVNQGNQNGTPAGNSCLSAVTSALNSSTAASEYQ